MPYDENVLCFVFYATITGYNFVKYFGIAKFHHRRLTVWLKVIQIFSLISFVLMCYYALQLPKTLLVYSAVFALITFFYAIPFLPKRLFIDQHQNLRSISTIPQKIGVKQTKRFGMVLVGLVFFLEFLKDDISGHQTLVLFIALLLLLVLLLCSKVEQSKYYSSFWVEGWPILWLLLTLGFN